MDAAQLREQCLSMPGSFEDFPFGPDASVFKVRATIDGARHPTKMFALVALEGLPLSVSLKCEPALAVRLRIDYDEITTAYHFNKTHWNGVRLDGRLPDQMVVEMIEDSYDLVVSTLNREQKALLGWSRSD